MPEEEPNYVPPQPGLETPPEPPAESVEQQLAFERGRNAALTEQLERQPAVTAQPAANAPPQEAPISDNPLDLLTPARREALRTMRATDPEAYESEMATLASQHAQIKMARAAGGIISNSARSIIDSFRARKSYEDAAYFKDVAPLFDTAINALGTGIQGLLNMSPQQQTDELDMRWRSCKAGVLEKQQSDARRAAKPEPPPLNGGGSGPGGSPVITKVEETDPMIAMMAARYGFTPAQLQQLNEANV